MTKWILYWTEPEKKAVAFYCFEWWIEVETKTSSPSQSSQTARFFRFDDAEQSAEKSIEQKPNSDIPILNGTVEKPKEEAVPLTESKPEDEEQYSAEKKALMLDLIHEKKAELLNKIQRINLLNQQIAELDAPAERDVSALRRLPFLSLKASISRLWRKSRTKFVVWLLNMIIQTKQRYSLALNTHDSNDPLQMFLSI